MPDPVAVDDWTLIQGETIAKDYDLENPDESPFDLTGAVLWVQWAQLPGKEPKAFGAVGLRGPALSGLIQVQLPSAACFEIRVDTHFDVFYLHPTFGGKRLVQGTCPVSLAVTHPTP